MKVLVIGGGGREHALCWALRRSPRVTDLLCAPGNGGIAAIARCLPLDVADLQATLALIDREQPGLTIIGPELPLSLGLADALHACRLPVFGPTRAAAMLETSKAFAKQFMQRHLIPTAQYAVCANEPEIHAALAAMPPQVVVKADGLASGKGVVLCQSTAEAASTATAMLRGGIPGVPPGSVLLEELLEGPEISFFAVSNGRRAVALGAAQDHKRIGEGDTGPNTGGMGAYSTGTLISPEMSHWLLQHVAQRAVDGMAAEGTPFRGVLFCGIMLTPVGHKVLEFNTRFGDPETQALMMRLETPLLDLVEWSIDLADRPFEVDLIPGASACVIAASLGYPGLYASGRPIAGADTFCDWNGTTELFHSGTALREGALVTAGGRVLGMAAIAPDLREALGKAYSSLAEVSFEGMQYRRDIGWRASNSS